MTTTRALEDAEIMAMFAKIDGRYALRDRTMLIVAIHMALRATELCGLEVGDVYDGQQVRRYVTIRPETAKRHKERKSRLSSDVQQALADFIASKREHGESIDPSAPLFVSQMGGHLSRKTLFVIVKRILSRAGITESAHALRKTGATIYYIESDFDLIATQHFLGHADPSTTRDYIGLTSNQLALYAERSGKHLFEAIRKGTSEKLDTNRDLSKFDLSKVPTAALIWELHDRGMNVESLAEPVATPQPARKIASANGKIIHLNVRWKPSASPRQSSAHRTLSKARCRSPIRPAP
ncbi:site-specific integrase [Candidatus Poribacteria bacterium]|nr:site-specific integrase [Candidatus Poribacteria bacterium]